MENLSYLDQLTGISNRRRLDEILEIEWQRALLTEEKLAFIMIDIDFFKSYNDEFGHLAGDEVLRIIATAIASCSRESTDIVARYGGEEFAVLLPNTDLRGAVVLAETIRKKVLNLNIASAEKKASDSVTISLGCAALQPKAEGEPLELIKLADKQLYYAKTKGRNRTEPQYYEE